MTTLELISFELCPFVQRSVITLLEKEVDFDITYIDLANKPDWFLNISPLGKVPVLKVNNSEVLFESAVINEYLDEITPPMLMPNDVLAKAKLRAWIEYASAILGSQYAWMLSSAVDYNTKQADYFSKLDYLERNITPAPFFAGDHFTLADAALAPALMRHALVDQWQGERSLSKWRQLSELQQCYAERLSIRDSVVPHFETALKSYLQKSGSAILA